MGLSWNSDGQSLYNDPKAIKLVKKATHEIYSMDSDSVEYHIRKVEDYLPSHPVVSLLKGIHVLWYNIPVLNDSTFDRFGYYMYKTVDKARKLRALYAEGVYFEMAAKGLMAEYYADRGLYMKAFNEANRAYTLLKEGFKLTDEVPDFLFATGIYNYFREAYPDRYPIYRPLLWFFRAGDKEKGINQIKKATQEAILVDIEAYIYLAYIYLRYEETPIKAQTYLEELLEVYPNNLYIQAKYLESLNAPEYYENLPEDIINSLIGSGRTYYQMAGYVFRGIYHEKVLGDDNNAYKYYNYAIGKGKELGGYGDYYQSYAYLGLGNILSRKDLSDSANSYYEKAIEVAQTDEVKEEAELAMN